MGSGPRSQEGGPDPTVREFLPWHVVKQKLADRGADLTGLEDHDSDAGELQEEAPAPMSGVCVSEKSAESDDAAVLSYRVYTLADLEARGVESSPRLSRIAFEAAAPKAPPSWAAWRKVASLLLTLGSSAFAWGTTKGQRPPFLATLTPPFDAFADALQDALERVEWRKVVTGVSVGVGTAAVLLFVVLTAAELTDDLKPARTGASRAAATFDSPRQVAAPQTEPAPARASEVAPALVADAPAVAEPLFELPDETPPAPALAARRTPHAKKSVRAKGKLTFRNADEIFRP
jgi:hypothetical protein